MFRIKQLISLFLLLSLVIAIGAPVGAESSPKTGLKVGNKAPNFTLTNLEGVEVSLSDFRGQYLVLNFWASWCSPCRREMPELDKFHQQNDNFTVLAVNIGDSRTRTKEFITSNNYKFPVLVDQARKVRSLYQVSLIPTSYFLNSEGTIEYIRRGGVTLGQLEKIKASLVEEDQ